MDALANGAAELERLTKAIAEKRAECQNVNQILLRLQTAAKKYEDEMRITREADEQRGADLDKREANLKARERRLQQDMADFEQRRKRFRQLQEISRHAPHA